MAMNNPEPAPLFGSWRRAYFIALTLFVLEIVLLYVFTVRFS